MKHATFLLLGVSATLLFAPRACAAIVTYSGGGELQYVAGNPFTFGDTPTPFHFKLNVAADTPPLFTTSNYELHRISSGQLLIDSREALLLPDFDNSSSTISVQDLNKDVFGFTLAFSIDNATSKISGSYRFENGTFAFDARPPVFSSLTSGFSGTLSGSGNAGAFGQVYVVISESSVLSASVSSVPEPASSLGIGVFLSAFWLGRFRRRTNVALF